MHRKITRRKFVELFAANPAKVVGLPNKGDLRIGADADVVIFDPEWKGVITNKDSFMELIMSHLKDLKSRDALNRYICAAGWWPKWCVRWRTGGDNGRMPALRPVL